MEKENIKFGIKIFCLCLSLCLVLLAYCVLTQQTAAYEERWDHNYDMLARSLLAGHLNLPIAMPNEMKLLADPYDSDLNGYFRHPPSPPPLHDLSLYQGKFYLYFGVTPAILLYLPVKMFGYSMPNWLAVVIFNGLALLAVFGVLINIARATDLTPKTWMYFFAFWLLALFPIPFVLFKVRVYEVAVSCAYFCVMLSLYLFSKVWASKYINKLLLGIASLFLALSVGARANYIFFGLLLISLSIVLFQIQKIESQKEKIKTQFSLWLPYIFIGCCLATYNYLRFGSIVEFGQYYQLSGIKNESENLFQFKNILPGLFFYIFYPVVLGFSLPFFSIASKFFEKINLPEGYIVDGVVGILPFIPFLLILFLLLYLWFYYKNEKLNFHYKSLYLIIVGFILIGIIELMFLCFMMKSTVYRYMLDFIPFFILAGILFWFALNKINCSKQFKYAINTFGIMSIIYTCGLSLFIGFGSHSLLDDFKRRQFLEKLNFSLFGMQYKTEIKPISVYAESEADAFRASNLLLSQNDKNINTTWMSIGGQSSYIRFYFLHPSSVNLVYLTARKTILNEFWKKYTIIGYLNNNAVYVKNVTAEFPIYKSTQSFCLTKKQVDSIAIIGHLPMDVDPNGKHVTSGVNPGFSKVEFVNKAFCL